MQAHDATDLRIAGASLDALRATRRWALVLGGFWIAGMIGGGAASVAVYPRLMPAGMPGASAAEELIFPLVGWILDAVVVGFLITFALQYASRLRKALASGAPADLERALHSQRRFWKTLGIILIVVLAIAVLAMLAAIVIPLLLVASHA